MKRDLNGNFMGAAAEQASGQAFTRALQTSRGAIVRPIFGRDPKSGR
jgi:hypothetical protein